MKGESIAALRPAAQGTGEPFVPLSVIVPVYNEVATVVPLLDRVARSPYDKQIIAVNDGSTDGSREALLHWRDRQPDGVAVVVLLHETNRGKGAAIRTGLAAARGEVTLIQDADLEYDPDDYPLLVEPILQGEAEAVYGSRYLRRDNPLPWTPNRVCVHLLNVMVRILYRQRITDEATCYKACRTAVLRRAQLRCERFEFCPEITAKLCRMGIPIREVPIRYAPRTASAGKKIGWRDGVEAIRTLIYWRWARFQPLPESAAWPAESKPTGVVGNGR